MKHKYFTFVALAATAVATSCSLDDLEGLIQHSGEAQTVTLTASVDGNNDVTRVGMTKSEDGTTASFYWHKGDKIFVQTVNDGTYGGAEFTTEAATGAESATFTGEVTGTVGQYAVYPYNKNHKFELDESTSKTKLTYNLPASYEYKTVGNNIFSKDGTCPSNSTNMPMLGTIADGKITFKHLGGLAVIRIDKMPAESGTITVTADQQLCGNFTVEDLSADETQIATPSTTTATDNTVTFTFSGATKDGVGVFYLPLATGSYSNVKITVVYNSITQTIYSGSFYVGRKSVTAIPINRNAYDIAAENDGVTIHYYKFNNNGKTELAVTYLNYGENNYSATKVDIPASVTDGENTYSVTAIGEGAFYNCSNLTSIEIPDGVTSIGARAFYGCSVLNNVTIPGGVKAIGVAAFYDCTGLKSVTIGSGVTTIGFCAFHGCGLTSVTIPNNVTSIEEGAFSECTSLANVTIGSGVTTIGKDAFYRCTGLTSVTIPDNVTSIEDEAFLSCSYLTSVTIGSGVTKIGEKAFEGCSRLTSVTIGSNVETIGVYAFEGCSKLSSITIPDKVTSIGDNAFQSCTGLTSVTIGSNVETIGKRAFQKCSSLTSIDIPSKVTSIGDYAFYKCTGLESVKIGSGVKTIGENAFAYDTDIKTLSVSATTPPTIYSNTFSNTSNIALYVPTNSVDTYKATQYWQNFTNIQGM